ncbi:type II secretion system F family protein [Kamptonema cortianum]|nr:type II secretion system F family protein [Geitlerinema splendidum]MDK3161170.1 type II secretion system F family protein [Kamptonema cortianum]
MPTFEYSAIDDHGQVHKGLTQGQSLDAVAQSLSDKGWQVQSLSIATSNFDPIPPPSHGGQSQQSTPPPTDQRSVFLTDVIGPAVGGVELKHMQFFFRQLGTMLNAGIAPAHALETLTTQTKDSKLRSIVAETGGHVTAGRPMSVGFQRYPEVFTPIMMGMVRAGEEAGFLGDQCIRLSEYIQRDLELRNMIRRETFQPKLVLFMSVIIILATNMIIQFIKPGARGLPVPSLLWMVIGAVLAFGIIFNKWALRIPGVRRSWDEFVLGIPVISGMVHGFAMAKFGRAFGAMHEAGLPLGRATKLAADSCGNEALRYRIYGAVAKMDSGESIYETFRETGAFNAIVLDMLKAGEMTGNINEMLVKVSEYYEDDGATKARQGAMTLGAVLLLLVGAYVAYILISFYTGYALDRVSGV